MNLTNNSITLKNINNFRIIFYYYLIILKQKFEKHINNHLIHLNYYINYNIIISKSSKIN